MFNIIVGKSKSVKAEKSCLFVRVFSVDNMCEIIALGVDLLLLLFYFGGYISRKKRGWRGRSDSGFSYLYLYCLYVPSGTQIIKTRC